MNQRLLVQRETMASIHQLGAFVREYPKRFASWIKDSGITMAVGCLVGIIIYGLNETTLLVIGLFMGVGCVSLGWYYFARFRGTSLYLYTDGMLYFQTGERPQAVRWEQIRETELTRWWCDLFLAYGYLTVHLDKGTYISFTGDVYDLRELRAIIEGSRQHT